MHGDDHVHVRAHSNEKAGIGRKTNFDGDAPAAVRVPRDARRNHSTEAAQPLPQGARRR